MQIHKIATPSNLFIGKLNIYETSKTLLVKNFRKQLQVLRSWTYSFRRDNIKTQIQVTSTHAMPEMEEMAVVSLDVSNSHLDILAKCSNCLHLQSCCFGSSGERVVMLTLYMVWKSSRSNLTAMKTLISFSTRRNILHFHLRCFRSPTMSSSHWTSYQRAAPSAAKMETLMLMIFIWTSAW